MIIIIPIWLIVLVVVLVLIVAVVIWAIWAFSSVTEYVEHEHGIGCRPRNNPPTSGGADDAEKKP